MSVNKHLLKILEKLDLTESEAVFYVKLLKRPNSSIREMILETGFSQATVYRIVENLSQKGFIITDAKNWKQKMTAISLPKLADKFLNEQRKFGKVAAELKKMSGLMSLNIPYEAEDAITVLTEYSDIAMHKINLIEKNWSVLKCIGSPDKMLEVVGDQVESHFIRKRVKKGKKSLVMITEAGEFADELVPRNEFELRTIKFNLDSHFKGQMFYMYDAEVTIWINDENFGKRAIIIRDPALVNIYQNSFEKSWSIS